MANTRKLRSLLVLSILTITYLTPISSSQPAAESTPIQKLDLTLPSTDTTTQKSRMRKHKNGKKKNFSTYRDMSFAELQEAKEEYIARKNYITAIKYIEQMTKLCDDATIIGDLWIEMADLLFLDEQYAQAAHRYAEYAAFYPGGEHVEYALSRAIKSSFECTLSHDRDQTKTEETLALAESFLQQDHLTTYAQDVIIIRDECYKKLAQSDISVCSFYINRGQLEPAESRIENIRSTWGLKVPDLEADVILLEQNICKQKEALAQKAAKNNLVAQNNTQPTKKNMTERF